MQMNELAEKITKETQENNWVAKSEPALLDKFPYLADKRLTKSDLQEITCQFPTVDPTALPELLCAIYGVEIGPAYESLVFTEKDCFRVACPVHQLISELLHNRKLIRKMRTIRKVFEEVFELEEMYTLPYVHPKYALMPLGSIESPTTAWVNPAYLADFIKAGLTAYLRYSFGLIIECDLRSERTILKRMTLAFKAFGIYQRDAMNRKSPPQQLLSRFLDVANNRLAQRALQRITVGSLPGEDGCFVLESWTYFGNLFILNDGNIKKTLKAL